ncbi:GNAT family N-acetyltransferase [Bacteroidota bacterium]
MPDILRKLDNSDIEKLVSMANNPAIADDMSTLPSPFQEQHALELVHKSKNKEDIVMGVIDSESNELAGVVMLRDFERQHEQAELSIWIGQEYWGKGLGTVAIIEMSRIGFEEQKLNRIYAYTMVRNIASQRILEKSGFSREGFLRERVIICGIYEDVYLYARLKKD